MIIKCSVIGCSNRKDREKDLQYYRIPAVIKNQGDECERLSTNRRRQWLAQLGQSFENKNIDNVRICSAHFVKGKRADLYDQLNPDWIPTINLRGCATPKPPVHNDSTTPSTSRYNRQKDRIQRRLDMSQFATAELTDTGPMDEDSETPCSSTKTDINGQYIEGMKHEIEALQSQNQHLKSQLSDKFSEKDFEGNDEKVNHLTGLSSHETLMLVFEYLLPYLPSSFVMTQFKMLIMTLMRLRLNLSVMFLAYEFGVSQATVSRVFTNVMDCMFARLHPMVHWPQREVLQKTMPMQFRKNFGKKVVSIIDCFEVFIKKPSNLQASAETYSSYKHHHTVKFLIGITPQGTVSYISKGWGGRTSDKYITEHCGYLNKLSPGDLILADRGFDISTSVGSLAASVNIPAFTKGRDQLSAADIESTRKLANVRIHVERVIGTVRQKYSFLNGTVPIRFLMFKDENDFTVLDKIAHVCCALVNLNASVVGFD
ncbi:hypothetical protein MAR_017356 [Mya arenaria]|uniref:THAP-type domain-containing protein n=1 Tax=Mya arenaria TaxID=6604 RepID=A0ABY7EBJ2_MYAAR|nr:hypothetical protein MAR_017356 [Mya arenaria]